MKKIILWFACAVSLLLIFAVNGFACTCGEYVVPTSLTVRVNDARESAKAVFSGSVLEIIDNGPHSYSKVTFNVDKVWKGDLPETVTVITGDKDECGFLFKIDKSYLIYALASGADERLHVNICTRTNEIERSKKDLEILGKEKTPKINH